MNIKKLDKSATVPTYATSQSGGLDLYLLKDVRLTSQVKLVRTGIAVAIPVGHVGLLALRSSLCLLGVRLANGVGIIDADYRGEVKIPLVFEALGTSYSMKAGDRVAQLILLPCFQQTLDIVKDLEHVEGVLRSVGT